jgi:hypothetical protein
MTRKILLVLPLLAATAACNTGASNGPSLDMMAQAQAPASVAATRATPPRATDVDNALARLPEGAGAVKAVRERNYPNGTSQDIALESDAPGALNHVAVAIQSGRALASKEKVPVWKPGEAGVKEELAREFSGLPMRVVVNGGYENRYGRFGVAIGRDGDALRCIYAWQYIEDARRAFGHGQRIQLSGAETAPAALRVKLCRADSTVDELVAHVKALVVDIPESYASAPPVTLRIPTERAPRAHASRAHYARRAPRTEPDPAPGVYPAPPGYGATPVAPPAYAPAYGGQLQPPRVQPPQFQPGQVQPPVAAGGPRYLAPVPGGAGGGMAPNAGLNPSLPPQAYRGPGAARPPADPGAPGARNSWQNPYQRVGARAGDAGVPPPGSTPPQSSSEGAPPVIPLAAAQ